MNQHKKHQQQIRPNMVPKINAPLFPTPVSAVTSPFNNLPPWNHQANSSFNNFPATPFAQMPFSNNESTNIPTFQNVNILTDVSYLCFISVYAKGFGFIAEFVFSSFKL